MKVDNTKFRLIARPTVEEYSILGVSTKMNAFSNKKVLTSPEIDEDSTFITAYEKLVFVGTLKGNLHLFNGESL